MPEHADYDTMRDNQRHLYSIAMTMQEQLTKLTAMVENIQSEGGLPSSPKKSSRAPRVLEESAKTIQKHFRGYQTRKAYRAHRMQRRGERASRTRASTNLGLLSASRRPPRGGRPGPPSQN